MTCWLTWPLPHNISQQSIITLTLYAAISTTTDNSNINRSINPSSPRTSVPPSFNSGWWYDQAKPTHPYHHEMWSSALAKHLPLFLLWWNRERWQPVRRCPCQELMSCPLKIHTMSLFGVLRSRSKSSSSLPSRIEALDPKSSSAAVPTNKDPSNFQEQWWNSGHHVMQRSQAMSIENSCWEWEDGWSILRLLLTPLRCEKELMQMLINLKLGRFFPFPRKDETYIK